MFFLLFSAAVIKMEGGTDLDLQVLEVQTAAAGDASGGGATGGEKSQGESSGRNVRSQMEVESTGSRPEEANSKEVGEKRHLNEVRKNLNQSLFSLAEL